MPTFVTKAKALARLGLLASENSNRYAMGCVRFWMNDGRLVGEATDSRAAIQVYLEVDAPEPVLTGPVLIDAEFLRRLEGMVSPKQNVQVTLTSSAMTVALIESRVTLTCPASEGKFPLIAEVFPSPDRWVHVGLDAGLLFRAAKALSPEKSEQEAGRVVLSIPLNTRHAIMIRRSGDPHHSSRGAIMPIIPDDEQGFPCAKVMVRGEDGVYRVEEPRDES